jgi:hypothetical protein
MLADGLTKILPRQKFKEFICLLGLVDISHRLCNMRTIAILDVNAIYPNHS